jgi:predicted dehydrogenase
MMKPPIYIIGAGGIVNAAHLPAYRLAGFDVRGIYDLSYEKAAACNLPETFDSLESMLRAAPSNAIYDVAVPGSAMLPVLTQLPDRATVLMQKPMGEDYAQACRILELCRQKSLTAAVNFQLRYAPFMIAAKEMIAAGKLGALNDVEIYVNVCTPWHLWDFLFTAPRVEILYHSIHYVDLVRHLLGNPQSVYAKTTRHSAMPQLASVRSNIILDYGEMVRANILTNHCHDYGTTHQQSYIKLEGEKGAIKINFGALIDYPHGVADTFSYTFNGADWQSLDVAGTWFPHAFIGSMAELMHGGTPDNSVEDCIHTMACVEAAYLSSQRGGVSLGEVAS